MAVPGTPANFVVQQGNGDIYLFWDPTSTATSYKYYRSTDGTTYTLIASPTVPYYLDTSATVGTEYWVKVLAHNSDGDGSATTAETIVPTETGDLSLQQVRLLSQQRADMVSSQFITTKEWNSYIIQSYFELYDLLVTTYEDYYVSSYNITLTSAAQYTLQSDVLKVAGLDLFLNTGTQACVTLKKFNFIGRNRFVFPQIPATYLGPFTLQYRLVGNTLMFIPAPSAGLVVRVWYVPKLTQPLQENDILYGFDGWLEYVIVDAAIKALTKEESDTSALMADKMALIKRIEDSANNRDEGQGDTVSDTRTRADRWGYGGGNGDGSWGGS